MIIAPLDYTCRVCENQIVGHVIPKDIDRGLVIDISSHHRIEKFKCRECDQWRTFVSTSHLHGITHD